MNETIANLYLQQKTNQTPDEFTLVSFEPELRGGVMTHPYLMSSLAYHRLSSPIHRGIFVSRRLLNRTLKPPPQATEFKDGDFDPHLTTREKVALLTKPEACMTCHTIINPLGFTMENFDAIGRFRKQEGKKTVDTKTVYETQARKEIKFANANDLAEYVATNPEAHAAFVDHLFHHSAKQPINAYGKETRTRLTKEFSSNGYHIQNLWSKIAVEIALYPNQSPTIVARP